MPAVIASFSYPPIPIFHVGPLALSLHGVMAAVGFLAGARIASRRLAARGYDAEAYQAVLSWALVGALVGARYLTTPAALLDGVPLGRALNPLGGNFSIMGGFAGGILVGMWRVRRLGMPLLPTLDASAFGLALGTVVGRVGDMFIVEHLGRTTTVPWGYGIRPGYDVAPQHDALECAVGGADGLCGVYHHVAMYDLLGAAVLLGVLALLARRRLHYGQLFAVWVLWYGFQRFLLDFLRYGMGDRTLGPLTWNQVSGLGVGFLGIVLLLSFGSRSAVVSAETDRELAGSGAAGPADGT